MTQAQQMPVREMVTLERIERACLFLGQRLATLAIFAFVGGIAGILASRGLLGETARASAPPSVYGGLLVGTFVLADLSLIVAFLAGWIDYNWKRYVREPAGLMAVNLVLMMAALTLLILARTHSLEGLVENITRHFAP